MLIKSELNARARLQYCRIARNGVGRGLWDVGNRTTLIPAARRAGYGDPVANGEWRMGLWGQSTAVVPGRSPGLDPGRRGRGSSGECRIGSGERGRGLREVHCLRRHARPRAGHRRLSAASTGGKTGMAGTGPAMTWRGRPTRPLLNPALTPTPHAPFATPHSPFANGSRSPPAARRGRWRRVSHSPPSTPHFPFAIDPFPAFGAALRAPLTRQGRQDRASH
jgi:hypothetical protein